MLLHQERLIPITHQPMSATGPDDTGGGDGEEREEEEREEEDGEEKSVVSLLVMVTLPRAKIQENIVFSLVETRCISDTALMLFSVSSSSSLIDKR